MNVCLIFVLIKNIDNLFKNWNYCKKRFNGSDFYLFNGSISENGDLIYSQYGDIRISDRLKSYINNQKICFKTYKKEKIVSKNLANMQNFFPN